MNPDNLADELDHPKHGLTFERGFWRQANGAVVIWHEGRRRVLGAPSNRWKQHGENIHNLWRWSEEQVAIGHHLLLEQGVLPPSTLVDDRDARTQWVMRCKEAAGAHRKAQQGSHVHLLTELQDRGLAWLDQLDRGRYIGLPAPMQEAAVEAWLRMLDCWGLEIVAVEQTVVSWHTGTAGTFDRLVRTTRPLEFVLPDGTPAIIPAGKIVVLDIKTGDLKLDRRGSPRYWLGYALQQLCYATGQPVTVDPTDPHNTTIGKWEWEVSNIHALIAHLRVDEHMATCQLVYVDLVEVSELESAVEHVRAVRKLEPFGQVDSTPEIVVEVPGLTETDDVSYEMVMGWLQQRIDRIGTHPKARTMLNRYWPADVVPPSQGMAHTHVDRVAALLSRIESECELPFTFRDPRAPRSGHKDRMSDRAAVQPYTEKAQTHE